MTWLVANVNGPVANLLKGLDIFDQRIVLQEILLLETPTLLILKTSDTATIPSEEIIAQLSEYDIEIPVQRNFSLDGTLT